jgi:glutathione synthase/RimK-type ligase-like ATP-grasp enzyme
MDILLIGTQNTAEHAAAYYEDYVAFFEKSLKLSGKSGSVEYCFVEDLIITVGDGEFTVRNSRHDRDITDYQLVCIRGYLRQYIDEVKAVSEYLKQHNVPVANDYSSFRSSSKLVQAVQFHLADLPVARTILVTQAVIDKLADIDLEFPCIMKAVFGAHGNDNYLVHAPAEITKIIKENPEQNFVLQRFVQNNGDYRILVVGGQVATIHRQRSGDGHLNNTSQGAKARLLSPDALPAEIIEQAKKISRQLHMTVAGVDVLYDQATGQHSFLEVNAQPQLMTGAFVEVKEQLFADYLKSLKD